MSKRAAFLCAAEAAPMDDRALRYIAAASPAFEDLRDVASQLAGMMVLAGSGYRAATPEHPMIAVAGERWRAARDAAAAIDPPPQGAHHHHHLMLAAERLGAALTAFGETREAGGRVAACMPPLRESWAEIIHTANALPGFRALDLGQACCAAHAKMRQASSPG